jgi:hypothetical protein
LYGRDYDEQWAIVLAMTQSEVTKIYEKSKHYANGAEHAIVHAKPLEETSWCILGNSRSDVGTKNWPRMIHVSPHAYAWAGWEARRWTVSQ